MLDLSSTSRLLTGGGDARIDCEPNGRNQYGCQPWPEPGALAYNSSTASTISAEGFASAEALRQRLSDEVSHDRASVVYTRHMERLRRELIALSGLADLPGVEIIFGASGTDLHLIGSQMMPVAPGASLILHIGSSETGSGVPAALSGRHFSTHSPLGHAVTTHAELGPGAARDTHEVRCRDESGTARNASSIESEIEDVVTRAATEGRRVLLVLADLSKTGLIVPSCACALRLHRRFPGMVEVLVDACQMRISSSTLRAYLEHDFIVAVTGSKFVAGPAFCGALFIPAKAARRLKKSPLPATLAAYSARGDWPQDWPAAALPDVANFGLLLRWEAALTELRAFRALSPDSIRHFLEMFTATIGADIRNEPALELLSTPALDRCAIGAGKGWDQVQTLFPFLLKRPPSSQKQRWLNRDETRKIYELLRTDCSTVSSEIAATVLATRCEVGQPVACGLRDGILVSALRLGLSTRLIVDALSPQGRGAGPVLADAICVLKKAAWLASRSS